MIKRWAEKFLIWYCHQDYCPDIRGDLEELYQEYLEEGNIRKAQWSYLLEVLGLFRPSLMRPFFKNLIICTGMLRNYFKISIRNLVNHKVYASINIIGLAIGLAAFLLINEYIRFERSYDKFFSTSEQLYRLTTDQIRDGVLGVRDAMSFNPSGRALKEELPEVIDYTTTYKFSEIVFRHNDQVRYEKNVVGADSNYFKLFDYDLMQGDPETALVQPYSIVLTQSKARSYFGNEDPMGKTIELLSAFERPFMVTGVMQDVPENTHYKFDILLSINSVRDRLEQDEWNGFNYYTYLLLDKQTDLASVRAKLPGLSRKYIGEESTLVFNIQPVGSIHLHSDFTYEPEIHGSAEAVGYLVIISFFVLIIAWVNYVNLSTARAVDRAKEVGLRKVIGAHKGHLIGQFLFESLLINLIGALLAILIVELTLPFFNNLIEKEIATHLWNQQNFLLMVGLFFVAGTFITGFYPALVLSGFRPVTVLKGKFRNSKSGVFLRKSLVVLQFFVSLVLIAGTLIVIRQVEYMQSRDLGMDISGVVGFRNPSVAPEQQEQFMEKVKAFHEELRSKRGIGGVGSVSVLPGGGSSEIWSSSGGVKIVGLTERLDATTYIQVFDDKVLPTLGMDLLAGRNFDRDRATDTAAVIVNEAFLLRFDINTPYDQLLNEKIQMGRDPDNQKFNIIGIVRNSNRTSLKSSVEPTAFYFGEGRWNTVVKVNRQSYNEGMQAIEDTWSKFFPSTPLDIQYIDQRFARLYQEDKRFGKVFGIFSVLAIIVSILGLFGLSSFMAIQRTKEVGVRKVLGASVAQIIAIFYKDFLLLIGFSVLIGFPTVFMVMNNWLDGYAYRIAFPWVILVLSVGIVLFFALITVGYQTFKVAVVNPSNTLRYE